MGFQVTCAPRDTHSDHSAVSLPQLTESFCDRQRASCDKWMKQPINPEYTINDVSH